MARPPKRSRRNGIRRPPEYIPLDVLEVIFTFLPIKKAIQFGVVAKRFTDTWLLSRRLDFGRAFARSRTMYQYFSIVDKVLTLHEGPTIESLTLYFDPTGRENEVRNWVDIIVSKRVEELDLDFFGAWSSRKFSLGALDLPFVRTLKLSFCDFVFPQSQDCLRLLTTLVLKSVIVTTKTIETVVENCTLLETLDIVNSRISGQILVLAHHLKRFATLRIGDCPDVNHIEIDSPTLRSFHYVGKIPFLVLENVFRLDDVILNVRSPPGAFVPTFRVRSALWDISHIRVLSVTGIFLEGLASTYFDTMRGVNSAYCLWNLKELQIFVEGSLICNAYDIASFIAHCPSLERVFIDLKESSLESSVFFEAHQKQDLEKFFGILQQLKFAQMSNFQFRQNELDLVKFFLQKATKLETLVLTTPKIATQEVTLASMRAYNIVATWKASPDAQIFISQHSNNQCGVSPMHSRTWFSL